MLINFHYFDSQAIPEEMVDTYLPALLEMNTAEKIMQSVTCLLAVLGVFSLFTSVVFYLKHKKLYCFRENQVVSNMNLAHSAHSNGKASDKRTVYNIAVSPVENENLNQTYTSSLAFPEVNISVKKATNVSYS